MEFCVCCLERRLALDGGDGSDFQVFVILFLCYEFYFGCIDLNCDENEVRFVNFVSVFLMGCLLLL